MKTSQLRNRIISYFVGTAVFISVLYGVTSFLFAYNIEDHFFSALLNDEAQVINEQLSQGASPEPRLDFIRYYSTHAALPDAIKQALVSEPKRIEFTGEKGQHFHLKQLKQGVLLAEVSEHLMVRKIRQEMVYFLLTLLAIVTGVAILMGFASYAMAKSLLKPLDKLMDILANAPVERLPRGFARQFQHDEIGVFAQALEQALARIREFIEREQHFTRDVSHELRTPVTISHGAITLLKKTSLDDKQLTLVNRIEQAQLQMEQSLSALLALAREDTSSPCSSRLLPLVEQSILQQHSYLSAKNVQLTVSISPQLDVAIAAAPLLILLNNLIGNAFKYTDEGHIDIGYSNNTLYIKNSGSGITPQLLTQVFESGIKGDNSQGFGMGLSIVKRLCEQLNLTYELNSTPQGTEFKIEFTSH
jgi:signal transduction histidine kinase